MIPLPYRWNRLRIAAADAKRAFGLPESSLVVLWLGRLSLLTKLDPWPTYQVLERVAQQLDSPLVLVECGPDDQPSPNELLDAHRQLCPSVRFVRLGGTQPVSEQVKHQALAAADVAVSLVDNPQETFGRLQPKPWRRGSLVVSTEWLS